MADFYTVEKRDGCWWFIAPDGAPFWSIGMDHIELDSYTSSTNTFVRGDFP